MRRNASNAAKPCAPRVRSSMRPKLPEPRLTRHAGDKHAEAMAERTLRTVAHAETWAEQRGRPLPV